jgi:hypothetical protein
VTTRARASLRGVSTTVLAQLRQAMAEGRLRAPLDRAALVGFGLRHQLDAIEGALGGHMTAACLAVLDVVLEERSAQRRPPELVWTGPEAQAGTARDTAVVLRALFEEARESVILGGYSFSHAHEVLSPLHASMRANQVQARFFVHIPQLERGQDAASHLATQLEAFLAQSWPFGLPRPRLYYDKRALVPGPPFSSLHAKCVVVDGSKAFVSSANFTQRAHERNIEVGVFIEDENFAGYLAAQWLGLIDAGVAAEYVPGPSSTSATTSRSTTTSQAGDAPRSALADLASELPEAIPLFTALAAGSYPSPEADFALRDARGAIEAEAVLHWPVAKLVVAYDLSEREIAAWTKAGYRSLSADEVFADPTDLLQCLTSIRDD